MLKLGPFSPSSLTFSILLPPIFQIAKKFGPIMILQTDMVMTGSCLLHQLERKLKCPLSHNQISYSGTLKDDSEETINK